jgi:hypothetical protein
MKWVTTAFIKLTEAHPQEKVLLFYISPIYIENKMATFERGSAYWLPIHIHLLEKLLYLISKVFVLSPFFDEKA